VAEGHFEGRLGDGARRASTPFFRMRPAATSSAAANSWRP
jgi:hypothetical protein